MEFSSFPKIIPLTKKEKKEMENLLSLSFPQKNGIYYTSDGHGGRGEEHRAEMQAIATKVAEQKIREIVPQMAQEIYTKSLDSILRGIQYDIETIVNVAFDDGRDIFTSSRARKMVSEAIYKEVLKGVKKESFKIEF